MRRLNDLKLWALMKFTKANRKKSNHRRFSSIPVSLPNIEARQESRRPALGSIRDITMELDAEAQTLWKNRSPFIK